MKVHATGRPCGATSGPTEPPLALLVAWTTPRHRERVCEACHAVCLAEAVPESPDMVWTSGTDAWDAGPANPEADFAALGLRR